MGFGDDIREFENDVTGQGGNDGDNNANNANGSNDKTVDTIVDSGSYPCSTPPTSIWVFTTFRCNISLRAIC